MGDPFDAGAVHEMVAEEFPRSAVGAAGVAGGPRGATAAEGREKSDAPDTFIAIASKW